VDAVDFGSGWHSHLAVLEQKLRDEAVPNFCAFHGKAEALMKTNLGMDTF
jgi:hypothetical protein